MGDDAGYIYNLYGFGLITEMELLQAVVTTIRTARAERSVKPSARITASVEGAGDVSRAVLDRYRPYLMTLAGLTAFDLVGAAPSGEDVVTRVVNDLRVHIQMPHTDRAAEIEKLTKHHAETVKQIGSIDQKLSNEAFVGKAPAHVVDQARRRRQELAVEQRKIEDTLRELSGR